MRRFTHADEEKAIRAKHETRWHKFRQASLCTRETVHHALGIPYDTMPFNNHSPGDFSADQLARLETYLRAEFMASLEHSLEAMNNERLRWFMRVLPSRALDTALEADWTKAIEAMDNWENNESTEIAILLGPPGTGKTVAAAWWAWEFLPGVWPPMFVTGAELARSSRYEADRDRLLASAFERPALILDDLGAENHVADIDELVDRFYGERGRLVITSNLSLQDFHSRYGDRVADRLREAGRIIVLTGPSLRVRPEPLSPRDGEDVS